VRWASVALGGHQTQLWVELLPAPAPSGGGRRFAAERHAARARAGAAGCSSAGWAPDPAEDPRCPGCGTSWSASHSGRYIAAGATSARRIGVDIQVPARRPAALRWLARIARTEEELGLAHWAVGEAYWKASGQAHRRPLAGEITFPPALDLHQRALAGAGWIGEDVRIGATEHCSVFASATEAYVAAIVVIAGR
jgi:hypothetical protein